MKKLLTISSLMLILAACGSQVVEFPEQAGSNNNEEPDAGYPPFGLLPDSGNQDSDADADASDPNTPDASDDTDSGTSDDAGTDGGGEEDGGTCHSCTCDSRCQCENKCDDKLKTCQAKCEKECNVWTKKQCLNQCECDHDSCTKCCR